MTMKRNKVFVVIPTIRNLYFLKAWKNEFAKCHLIIVEDGAEKIVKTDNLNFASVTHLTHKDIEKDFGEKSWIFSRQNAGIRCYGFWKAYKMGADVIITLDDDCYPADADFVKKHLENLNRNLPAGWQPTYPNPKWIYTRGFPYKNRDKFPVAISNGLWSGALDLDAKTEIKLPKFLNEKAYPPLTQFIPFGFFYPMCSMNLAFKREVTPLMFFPMMGMTPEGEPWHYDRYDDIWAGLFSKKIMDHLKIGVVNGSPFVNHKKASITKHNHAKELKGMKVNEVLWKRVSEVKLTGKTPKACYIELAKKTKFPKEKYFSKLREAMVIWANLF
jgi:reversibly glycosylated polypeptide/UDP-arabinopyranose mutase